jgi:NAD(P)-dependent dehydrogenase (short-subunit alcohol dehydrogenase family)
MESIIEALYDCGTEGSSDTSFILQSDGARYTSAWQEIGDYCDPALFPWKTGGVYLIAGGAGSIGNLFAKEISRKVKQAVIILFGRSEADDCISSRIEGLKQAEVKAEYMQIDISDRNAVQRGIDMIKKKYGQLSGVIHSAAVTDDHFIIRKTAEQMSRVLAPKVSGTVNLDEATREENLDFFILFSSVASVFGNIGQADYSAANAFMNRYAKYRENLFSLQQRKGRTLALIWPYWQEGDIRIHEDVQDNWKQNIGMAALTAESGIEAFYQAWSSGHSEVLVLHGERGKLTEFVAAKTGSDESRLQGLTAPEQELPADSYTFCHDIIAKIAKQEITEEEFVRLFT